ncbi:hypothetical protein [Streptomyces sp. NPDC088184]|uniref:hypothetical protein n=1 Tax=Streptomyces sp. NPDC088184 TaxID=3160991 RepID=UPI0034347D22
MTKPASDQRRGGERRRLSESPAEARRETGFSEYRRGQERQGSSGGRRRRVSQETPFGT